MKRRSFLSLLLVFCMIMQMLAPAWARQVEGTTTSSTSQRSSDVSKAQKEFQKSYDTIMALEEVDLGKMASVCVGAVSAGENFGTWLSNGFDKVFNDGQNQKEYVDYIKQIEDANAKIRQAKKDAQAMKKQYDAGKIDDAKKADVNKIAEKGFVAQTQAVDTLRDTLTTAGTTLQKVGSICSEIGTVLGVVNAVLKVVSIAFAPSAPVIGPILLVTEPAATALGIAGPLIEAAGNSLVESAQAGQFTDQQLMKNMAVDVAIEGGKQVATELITNGITKGAGKVAEDIGKKYGDDIAKKLVGTCSGAWDPEGIYKAAITSDLTEVLGDKFLEDEAQEALSDAVDKTVDYALDKAGIEVPSVGGLVDSAVEAGLDYVGDAAGDALKNTNFKSVNDNAGLNAGNQSDDHGY